MLNLKLLYAIIAITFTVLASCNSVSQIAPHAIESSREINSPPTRYYEINNNLYHSKDIAGIEACKQAMEKTKEWWGEASNRKWKRKVKGVEYYGYICKTKDGQYGYSPPKEGTHPENLSEKFNGSTGVIGLRQGREICRAYFGQNAVLMGWYHSHIRSFSKFSKSDKILTNMMGITGYLANKSGALGGTRIFKLEPSADYDEGDKFTPFEEITKSYRD